MRPEDIVSPGSLRAAMGVAPVPFTQPGLDGKEGRAGDEKMETETGKTRSSEIGFDRFQK